YDQYLLYDPAPPATYDSGLIRSNGKQKAGYGAFRLPLYLPSTTASSGRSLEVWGDARPAPYALSDTGAQQSVDVQFQPKGGATWSTLQTVPITNPQGYFDVRVSFAQSGNVRLAYSYPATDSLLSLAGSTVYSRTVAITVK